VKAIPAIKVLVWLLALTPAVLLAISVYHVLWSPDPHWDLGPNPAERLQHRTGDWAIKFLMATLAITPLRKLTKFAPLIRFRRLLGLFAFFYVVLHFVTYIWFDKQFDIAEIWKDVYKRPYITVGFAALLMLIPMAITSTAGWIRRLGGKRWQFLHRSIYLAGLCAVIHFYWLVKSDISEPLMYGGIWAVLMLARLVPAVLKKKPVHTNRPTAVST
jgi:sulfoxide reductase heme-binding subunit YedZ